ncbi:MAG: hypothetical protein J5706_05725 [Elusimicrobiales bacterium]|nr:hypothetical protein [Elusimicrobiales bacterium]
MDSKTKIYLKIIQKNRTDNSIPTRIRTKDKPEIQKIYRQMRSEEHTSELQSRE